MAGTTSVLSTRFFLFIVQVPFAIVRGTCDSLVVLFSASSVGAVCGKRSTLSLPRQKSYMVLTCSMATTNNVQEEAPTTALERQVRTLATAVERLTKQNHDLEKQLNQKNAALNNQGADQEGTSAERRNQEGPQASNAPSRPE